MYNWPAMHAKNGVYYWGWEYSTVLLSILLSSLVAPSSPSGFSSLLFDNRIKVMVKSRKIRLHWPFLTLVPVQYLDMDETISSYFRPGHFALSTRRSTESYSGRLFSFIQRCHFICSTLSAKGNQIFNLKNRNQRTYILISFFDFFTNRIFNFEPCY